MKDKYDLVVVGGGLAGVCTAISAARLGCKVSLVQERPVLGGNSSSEIRVPLGSASNSNPWARETGIIEELFIEDRINNPGKVWLGHITPLWDLTLYSAVKKEQNIDLYLNTCAIDVIMDKGTSNKINKILCIQLGTEKKFYVKADLFIDATGDGVIAFKAGAETRMGREAKSEFGESMAPNQQDNFTQGNTLLFHASDAGYPVAYKAPEWAYNYPNDDHLIYRIHENINGGYWWIELGCPPYNTIEDNKTIHHELLRILLGVWDHIKNHGDHKADNMVLDWIGMVPGKRESRRIIGDYILSEKDLKENILHRDRVAYGGWFIDIHTPGGMLARNQPPSNFTFEPETIQEVQVSPYSIPYRSLYSKNIINLMMAGRNISVTHVALGSTRIMGTCAVVGQAVGTAAFFCKKYKIFPRDIYTKHINELQQNLLMEDCYIPYLENNDLEDLAKKAKIYASSSAKLEFNLGKLGKEYEHARERWVTLSDLRTERAQIFPVTSDRIDYVELLIKNPNDFSTSIEVLIQEVDNIWEMKDKNIIKKIEVLIPCNSLSWVKVPINISVSANKLYKITVKSLDEAYWMYNDESPTGTASSSKLKDKWSIIQKGSYSMRIFPEVYPYQPENILSGVTRPEKWTNIWISDPKKDFPQFLEMHFNDEISFNEIQIVFDTNLNRTRMMTPPLFKAPECVKDYAIFYECEGKWIQIFNLKNNYQRKSKIIFNDIYSTRKIRLEIYSSNGDPSARIYEIRIYKKI